MGIALYSLLNTGCRLPLHSGGAMGQQVSFWARTDKPQVAFAPLLNPHSPHSIFSIAITKVMEHLR